VTDVTVKLADGVREVTVEITGGEGDPLARAEEAATRMYGVAVSSGPVDGAPDSPAGHRAATPNAAKRSSP
jgi:hypothetical protein